MGEKNGFDGSYNVFDDVSSNMFMVNLGSFSCGVGSFENGLNSAYFGTFEDSLNMQHRVGSSFVNRGCENNVFDGFDELGLVENLYKLHIGDEISNMRSRDGRRNFGSQQGCGFGFDGNIFNGNDHFVHNPVYYHGNSGLNHTMRPCFDNSYANASYLDASLKKELSSLWGEDIVYQRPCMINSMFPGHHVHSSNQFGVNGRDDNLGSEMQNRYMANEPVLGNDIYGLGFSGVIGSEDLGVIDPFDASSRFTTMNERMSGASSGVNYHQPLMIDHVGMEDYGCLDDSIILDMDEKRTGLEKNSRTDIKLAKSLLKSALLGKVQHDKTRENGLAKSMSQDDETSGLNLRPESWRSISCIAKTQLGCRLLQRMLNERQYQDVQLIFNDIIDYVPELSFDPYGNYLVQKVLDVCNEDQITQVVRVITKDPGDIIRICKNSHGTRVVQKVIEKAKTRQQIALVLEALEAGFLDLITDVNGNHVLQQCLQCFTEEHNKFIFEGATNFCAEIATHRYGCCVLNQCIVHSSRCHQEKLVTEICANGLLLSQDSFGNYVIQNILELKIPSASVTLLSALKGHFVLLSMQKFSSHVVEKCLKCYGQSRPIIIHELLSVPRFGQLLQHPFANYVIQSALKVTKGPLRTLLVKAVQPYKSLHTNPYSKRIFSRNLLKK
ncbi:hypothetical protein Leryth_016949 [Lithospermum erythrorhizon]|nr:hypothetical protein Leryth_016949 [Lithospermum erythrorhizon]